MVVLEKTALHLSKSLNEYEWMSGFCLFGLTFFNSEKNIPLHSKDSTMDDLI